MSGEIYNKVLLVDPNYNEVTILHPNEPITKDVRIEWELEQEAVIRIENDDDALRIIIEEVGPQTINEDIEEAVPE